MDAIISAFTHAIAGVPAIALGAAFLWGILSVLLSPCHLAGIPLIVNFISGQMDITPRRAFALSGTFSIGMLVCIGVIGVITALLGRVAGDVGWVNYLVIGVFFLMGLVLLDVIPMNLNGPAVHRFRLRGLPGAFLLGLVFGVALGPCSFAFMVPVLGVTYKAGASVPLYYAVALLGLYGVGHCGTLAVAGASIDTVQRYLHWNESAKAPGIVKKVCGVLILLGGLYMLWKG